MTLALYGLGVSRGIAIGKVFLLQRDQLEIGELRLPDQRIDEEVERFESARETARQQLYRVRDHIPPDAPVDLASFIDTHLLMLEDDALTRVPIDLIRGRKCNAEWALKLQRDALVNIFEQMDDPYLRTRKDDVEHVVSRIQRILINESDQSDEEQVGQLQGHIVIARDLSPADAVLMQHRGIAAFVTEYGGTTSHTAIMARSLGIPAIVGVHNVHRYVRHEELVIVDGHQGALVVNPDQRIIDYYRVKKEKERERVAALDELKEEPAVSRDGQVIELLTNIELPEDVQASADVGAKGVGLFRTEFLFMNRDDMPDEEEQLAAYLEVINGVQGPVTIRTLDIGVDKPVNIKHWSELSTAGSVLGLRAIRLCLKEPSLFRPQLRAILRASAHGKVKLMIPMVSNVQEVLQVLSLIEDVKAELSAQGRAYDEELRVGAMIEVPAAALYADVLARYLDFLSLGTNDLVQYTVAADRIDDSVNYLYDPLHPGVLRLIQMTIDAGRKAGVPVSMCGEMAGDTRYTRLLLGMGLRQFSAHPALLLELKRRIHASDVNELEKRVGQVLKKADPFEVNALVEAINTEP